MAKYYRNRTRNYKWGRRSFRRVPRLSRRAMYTRKSNKTYRRYQSRLLKKGRALKSFSFYHVLDQALMHQVVQGGPLVPPDPIHLVGLYGTDYEVAGGVIAATANGNGRVDPNTGNPATLGNGLLVHMNQRNPSYNNSTGAFSAALIDLDYIANGFYRLNPDLKLSHFYVKGVKITVRADDTNKNTELFAVWQRLDGVAENPIKYKQTLNTLKLYLPAKPDSNGIPYNAPNHQEQLMWQIPVAWVGGPVLSKIKTKVYCSQRQVFISR